MFRPLIASEFIKLRRAAPIRLALAAPALLFALQLVTLFSRRYMNPAPPAVLWRELLGFSWILWLGLFTPALVAFEAICLIQPEHSGRHWKQLFALPLPRWQIFAAKMVVCALLVAASFIVFTAASVGGVLLFSASRGLHLGASVPWLDILSTASRAFVASWLLIVVQTWLSVRYPGFALPAGVAFAAMLFGYILIGANRDLFSWWYPWTLPINVRPDGLYEARNTLAPALFGAVAGLVLAPFASRDLARRIEDL